MYVLSRTMKNGNTKYVCMNKDNTYKTCIQKSKAITFSDPISAKNFLIGHKEYISVGYSVTSDLDLFMRNKDRYSIVAKSGVEYLSNKKYATDYDKTPFLTHDIEQAVHFCNEESAKKYIASSAPKNVRINTL